MGKFIDLEGQTFGSWTVLRFAKYRKGASYWVCRCSCGSQRAVSGGNLRSGGSTKCAECYRVARSRAADLAGQTFGKWRVLSRADVEANQAYWACLCECGNASIVPANHLKRGISTQCRECSYASRRLPESGNTYRQAHVRLSRERGPASKSPCIECGEIAQQWAYQHSAGEEESEEWREASAWGKGRMIPFTSNLDHYAPMCISCHVRLDLARSKERAA